jgi:hypothetical protein
MSLKSHRSLKMKIATLCSILLISCTFAFGQNLIGYKNTEIRRFMKENYKDMNFNKVRNTLYSYLKYSDNTERETILFFLSTDSICWSIRVICDTAMKHEKVKELDDNYQKLASDLWIDNRNGKNYLIKFKDEQWSCSYTIESYK